MTADEALTRIAEVYHTPLVEPIREELAALREERRHLLSRLPAVPILESDCTTLDQWRHRAMYLESQWSGCSRDCARIQTERDAARAEVEALRALLNEAQSFITPDAGWDYTTDKGGYLYDRIDAALSREGRDMTDVEIERYDANLRREGK